MRLEEIAEDEKIMLEVRAKNRTLLYQVKKIDNIKNGILLDTIMVDGKIINFNVEGIMISLIRYTPETIPDVWRGVKIVTVEKSGKKCYACVSDTPSSKMNNRGAYRMFIGDPGTARIGLNPSGVRVTVKDISNSGFAFLTDYDPVSSISIGTNVRLIFDTDGQRFDLSGTVVRMDGNIIGCKMPSADENVAQYISFKQRMKMNSKSKR